MAISLQGLEDMERAELTTAWAQTLGTPLPPSISQDIMRLAIAWEIQAQNVPTQIRALKAALRPHFNAAEANDGVMKGDAKNPPSTRPRAALTPGTRLARLWQDKTYVVDVLDKGFAYNGHLYGSLSPIAKLITGSHRSGPHFFGTDR